MTFTSSEKDTDDAKDSGPANLVAEKLFKSRAVTVFGEINDKIARTVTEKLLALAGESDETIFVYISSPGGHVESGDVVYDMFKFIKPQVKVIGTGWVASAATTIYLRVVRAFFVAFEQFFEPFRGSVAPPRRLLAGI
ncbi:MAG TPA: ATP-dependent Clp protease proteolytic subunit, partial [Gammaproteobacteria bacterium]|nr:ATP-dependent Clp protease proteolytic subunit [Gammaproteobacteria bacterium]